MSLLKQIELKAKKLVQSLIRGGIAPTVITISNRLNLNDYNKILLLRQDRIGDVLISTPFINQLKEINPEIEIHILLSERNMGTSEGIKIPIDKTLIFRKGFRKFRKLLKEIKLEKYDLIIDLYDNSSATSELIIKMARAKKSLGLDKENRNIYDFVVPLLNKSKFHPVLRVVNLISAFTEYPNESVLKLKYYLEKDVSDFANRQLKEIKDNYKIFGINLNGSDETKYWGTANYIEFINLVQSNYPQIKIITFNTKKYDNKADEIVGTTEAMKAPLTFSLNQYAAMLSNCDIILSPDTAAVHFASSFNIPCVALYSVRDREKFGMPWIPFNTPSLVFETNSSIREIKVEEVFKAFQGFIQTHLLG